MTVSLDTRRAVTRPEEWGSSCSVGTAIRPADARPRSRRRRSAGRRRRCARWPAARPRCRRWRAPKSTVALPPVPNAGVGRAVGVEARDRDLLVGLRVARDDDLAVRLERGVVGDVRPSRRSRWSPCRRCRRSGSGKPLDNSRVTVIVSAAARVAREHDPAVRLHQHRVRARRRPAASRGHRRRSPGRARRSAAAARPPRPPAVDRPATRIRPLAWRAIARPKSSPPKSIAAMPPVPNVASSAPPAFRRATWMLPPSGPEKPRAGACRWAARSTAMARPIAPQLKSFLPSPEKLVSSAPFGFSRATATRSSESPASTILPSGCSAAP